MTEAASFRVVCVSDTHGRHDRASLLRVPDGDMLLFAGDAGLETQRDVDDFDKWLGGLPHRHKVVTFGNMDRWAAGAAAAAGGRAAAAGGFCPRLLNAVTVCDGVVEVAGFTIVGSPWTPAYFGAWQLDTAAEAQRHWARLLPPDRRVDILLTHGPPRGYGDRASGKHVGDAALLEAVQALHRPPLLWVCGHIHEGFGPHHVPHPAAGGANQTAILLVNAATAYLFRGDATAAPRVVDLPSRAVSQPTLRATRRALAGLPQTADAAGEASGDEEHADSGGGGGGARGRSDAATAQSQQAPRIWKAPDDIVI